MLVTELRLPLPLGKGWGEGLAGLSFQNLFRRAATNGTLTKQEVCCRAVSPHPKPLPRGEGTNLNTYAILEQSVDKRRQRRALRQHQKNSKHDQSNHDRRQPVLLVLPHELPELTDYLCF